MHNVLIESNRIELWFLMSVRKFLRQCAQRQPLEHTATLWHTIYSFYDNFRCSVGHRDTPFKCQDWRPTRLCDVSCALQLSRRLDHVENNSWGSWTTLAQDRQIVCLFGFLTSSSATRLFRGRAPRLTPDNYKCWHTQDRVGRP